MNQNIINVLLVDDDEELHFITRRVLNSITNFQYELKSVYDVQTGYLEILSDHYDICFIDYRLGKEKGLSLVHDVIEKNCVTPLIVLTENSEQSIHVKILEAGAMDYLNKTEINGQLLERVIRYAIERKKKENQLIAINKQLQFLASNDVLTGIANRNQFNSELPIIVERCIRNQQSIAILYLDLDQFKQINDSFGHSYGDLLLQQVTKRLKKNLRKIDKIFRIGGDEFIIVVDGILNKEKVGKLAQKISKLLSEPFILLEHKCQISASMGITMANFETMRSPEQLTKEADIAMYSAKKNGRNNFQYYRSEFVEEFLEYSHLTVDLQQALANGELSLRYQPLVSFISNKIIGVEALLRWQHPTLGNIPPKVFIPIAEKTGLIISIGEWVFREACLQRKIWFNSGYISLLMAVNISICQLQEPNFVERMSRIISDTALNPKCLELEISESAITTNFQESANKMIELKKLGLRFVIDDFGTGYSNLGYLKHFPFDKIKIDKIFIDEITSSNNEQYIVEAIIEMAKKMELEVVAEGVETLEQVNYLREHHSDQVQGFYYSEPLTAEECTQLLANGSALIKTTTKP